MAREKRGLINLNEEIIKDFETRLRNEHSISEDDYNKAKQEIEIIIAR